jgi:hypothetical protein
MGHQCWIKPSSQEPVFANLLHESLKNVDESLAKRMQIVKWSSTLVKEVDAVIAYGNDETVNELRQITPNEKIFIGYGNKISIGIILKETTTSEGYRNWRDRVMRDIEVFELNGCLSPRILFIEGKELGLWASFEITLDKHPRIERVDAIDEIPEKLSSLKHHLSCVGVTGRISKLDSIRYELEGLGVTRICEMGQMQHPPLSWRNGGISLVKALGHLL